MDKPKNKIFQFFYQLFPFLLSGGILFLLFKEASNYNFLENIKNINLQAVLAGLLFFAAIKMVNTVRYGRVYGISDKTGLFFVLSFCNSLLSILPFRLGEVSYVKYFHERFNVSKTASVNKLVIIRLADYFVVYFLFVLSSFYVGSNIEKTSIKYISLATLALLLICGLGLMLLYYLKRKDFFSVTPQLEKVGKFLSQAKREFLKVNTSMLVFLFFSTTLYWLSRLLLSFIILHLLGVEISIGLVIFISLFLLLVGLAPVKTFADFGVLEAGWAYFLVQGGYEYNDILPTLINYHIILFIPVVFYGIAGYVLLKFRGNN